MLIANSKRVANIVRRHLAYLHIVINVQRTARDLGVLLVGGAGRRTSIQRQAPRGRTAVLPPALAQPLGTTALALRDPAKATGRKTKALTSIDPADDTEVPAATPAQNHPLVR